ncbi:sulfonate ABC transporter substrate-binding protein [Aeribacillus pallidus]|uniref:Putative aliphatic sulfonates-binding protein n=1 Tax=Aeribacillus pallidus TaxID=33936 RepID=A0A165Z3A6_9BACI|nr:sulfonate ABC transporter substrate-binding protein [Aeribacillus pallidus]
MRKSMFLSLIFLLVLWISGCGSKEEANETSSAEKSNAKAEEETLPDELRIGYQKSSILLFLKEKGSLEKILAEKGVKVTWHEFQSGPPLLEALNAGKIDVGYVGGAPAVLAGAVSDSELAYLAYEPEVYRAIVVPKDSSIQRIEDLKGKKVAFGKGSSAHYLLLTALESVGLTLNDITPVYLQPSDARGAFERGNVDAWVIWDPYLADAEESGGARIIADAKGLPRQYGFIVGRRDYFQENRELRNLVISELEKVHKEIQADKQGAAENFSQKTGISKDVWKQTLERREYGVFDITPEVVDAQQKLADTFLEAGLINEKINVQDAVLSD